MLDVGLRVIVLTFLSSLLNGAAAAREDGRSAKSPLKGWFDSPKSSRGTCCSDVDGFALSDPDWDTQNGRYSVGIEGNWIVVP